MKVIDWPIARIIVEERQKRPVGNLEGLIASIGLRLNSCEDVNGFRALKTCSA